MRETLSCIPSEKSASKFTKMKISRSGLSRVCDWDHVEIRVNGWDTPPVEVARIVYNRGLASRKQDALAFFTGSSGGWRDCRIGVAETGPVAKSVLLLLLLFSLISWAIILSKWSVVRRARVQSGRFLRAFRKAQRLQDVWPRSSEQFRPSPLVAVFSKAVPRTTAPRRQSRPGAVNNSTAVQRAMQIAASEELTRLNAICPGWPSLAQ